MELHVWIADHEQADLTSGENFDMEQALREVAAEVERFTAERFGVMFSVELVE